MTNDEIALQTLKPILEEMREQCRERAVSGELDEQGDAERRKEVLSIWLLNEIENNIEARIGMSNDD